MLAGKFVSPGKIELVPHPEPTLDPSRTGEIIFQPWHTCLCGSDLPYFDSSFDGEQVPYPRESGHSLHEMVGMIVATNGKKFRLGDKVLAVPTNQMGLFQRFALSEDRAIPLDTRVSPEEALLAQPLGTVIYGLKKLSTVLDRDVVVVGQGPIGQLFNISLRNLGARHIIGIDLLESRLAHSKKCGATETICNAKDDPVAAVKEILGGKLPEIVIEAVGHRAQAFNLCIELAAHRAEILFFGVPPNEINGIHWLELFRRNLTVHTSVNPDFARDFPLAMRWIGEKRVDVSPLITHRYPLSQMQKAFETFYNRLEGCLKVFVEFPS